MFRANVNLQRGDLEVAVADCDKAIELRPDLAQPYNNRGLARQRQQFCEAYVNRGTAYYAAGKKERALVDFSTAIRYSPADPITRDYRGSPRRSDLALQPVYACGWPQLSSYDDTLPRLNGL